MLTSISNLPIARRLLFAFLLAAVVPGLIIVFLGVSFITTLHAHSQAMPVSSGIFVLETGVALICAIAITAIIGYFTTKSITQPLDELSTLTRRIANGDTGARVNLVGHDEIYVVANSMNNMLDNIVHLIQETQSQRDALQTQVEKLVSEVSGVGEGDLRVQAQVTADALGVLADSFNYMVEELGSLVVRVKMVAGEVGHSTITILDRMTQLVETGDKQINQIGEAVIEVERMASASRKVAERSQVLYEVAHIARQDAQVGRASLAQAVEGIGRINDNVQMTAGKVQVLGERSRQINDVVEAIQSIAHQTNRLALDAAIQAAMAGEDGKGFGAVAADIRRLAERSRDQAGLIAQIVRSVREEIGSAAISMLDTQRETGIGANLTQEAGVALESIFAAVEHQAREIESINQMGMQQLHSSSAVAQIMHAVSESTQHSSLNTRDASQNMERLARLVEQLRASVEAFKLRENVESFNSTANHLPSGNNENAPQTISSMMRTVTASAQALRTPLPGIHNTGWPIHTDAPYPYSPSTSPNGNNNGGAWERSFFRADNSTPRLTNNPTPQEDIWKPYNQQVETDRGNHQG
ncbi:MAG TPA: methyl-accepting chemotaxis protein [Ktedonobacteraceae bacterium]|nr:methyl-accepting chemotaxis protein [Ktedonobacteraceae bacterium]